MPKNKDVSQAELQPQGDDALLVALATDEHAGKGGSYVFDPASGKRTPAPEFQPVSEKE